MSIKKIIASTLATGIMLGGIFIGSASACTEPPPPPPPTEPPPPPIKFEIKCHDDGTLWIRVTGYRTFESHNGTKPPGCGCGLPLPTSLGEVTGAELVRADNEDEVLISFVPNSNTFPGTQGLATTSPPNIVGGIPATFLFHVKLKEGIQCRNVRRDVGSALRRATLFTDAVSSTGVPTGGHPGSGTLLVELEEFTANAQSNGDVSLNWTTATERDSAGFHIWRAKVTDVQQITSALIDATGNSNNGATYSYTDTTASSGPYVYILQEIGDDGKIHFHIEHLQVTE
jgi:hypothetical protein